VCRASRRSAALWTFGPPGAAKSRFVALNGSMSALARSLDLTRAGLYAWLKRLRVDPEVWREET
jgi:transposase-like protein